MPLEHELCETMRFSFVLYPMSRFPQLQQLHVCLPYLHYDDFSREDKVWGQHKTKALH